MTAMRRSRLPSVMLCAVLLLGLLSGPAQAGPAENPAPAPAPSTPEEVISQLQGRYELLNAFEADFVQHLTNAATGMLDLRRGKIWYRQPGFVRWEIQAPEKELLVVGKKAVWDYFPDEKTAYRYRTADAMSSRTMLRFLAGRARLDQDFLVEMPTSAEAGLIILDLTPYEPEPGLVQARLWVDAKTFLLRRILLIDFYGNENKLELSRLTLDPVLEDSLFTFTPPAGTAVKDHTSSESGL